METEGTVFDLRGLIENSLLEWENMVAAVAIAGGCNLRCPFCHSWRYVTGLDHLQRLDPEALFSLLERQRGWIDGVVFTGGEPTLQPGLRDMMARVREFEVKTKLHTNGSRPEVVESLLADRLIDCLSLDYKAPLDERYFAAAGLGENRELLERVRESFRLAAASGVDREYHTTLLPALVGAGTVEEMGRALEPGGAWFLQQFEHGDCLDRRLVGSARFDGDELDKLAAAARAVHADVILKKGSSA